MMVQLSVPCHPHARSGLSPQSLALARHWPNVVCLGNSRALSLSHLSSLLRDLLISRELSISEIHSGEERERSSIG